MKHFTNSGLAYRVWIMTMLLHFTAITYSQNVDSSKALAHFTGSAGITNNGISVVPTFSFGKPAALLLMSVGKNRLSFEPDLRISLDAKRGGVALWWRYKFIMNGKFRLNAGAHPALNFIVHPDSSKDGSNAAMLTQWFLGGELAPYYVLSKNVSIGVYYLYAHGLQQNGPRNVHYLTVNSNIAKIKISGQVFLQWVPQIYYLNIDKNDGFFFTSTATLLKRSFPFSLQSTINKTIKTNIPGNIDFVWNVTLIYSFKG